MRDKRKHRFRKRKPPVTARTKQNFHFLSIDEPLTRFFFFSFFFLCFILREQCILRQLPFRCFIIEKSRSIETKTTPTPRIARDLQYAERFSLLQKRKKKKEKERNLSPEEIFFRSFFIRRLASDFQAESGRIEGEKVGARLIPPRDPGPARQTRNSVIVENDVCHT